MIQPVNSTLMMMRSVLLLRRALEAIKDSIHPSTDKRLQALVPEEEDFNRIEIMIPILTCFEPVSEALSGEKYTTVCMVIMKLYYVQHSPVTEVQKITRTIANSFGYLTLSKS